MKIILIDDSQTFREQLRVVLAGAGYSIVEAEDGVAGAAAIRAHPDAALVICDLHMPRRNGLELLQQLRTEGQSPPMLMLTTEGALDLLEKARAFGAKGWMVKPFKPAMLLATVRKLERRPPG